MKAATSLSLMLVIGLCLAPAAQADTSNWNIKSGFGDEITIKNGILGNKKRVVKDRLGDKYETSKGLFGNTSTEVNLLGNSYSKKKGIFGTRQTEVKSLLGDSIKTKKGWFGRRTTTVDASGMTSLLGSAISRATKKPLLPPIPVDDRGADVSSFGARMAGGMAGGENFPPPMSSMPENNRPADMSAPPAEELNLQPFDANETVQ
jgi:hypothetical protein